MNPYIPPMEIRSSRLRVARKLANMVNRSQSGLGRSMSSLTSPSHSVESSSMTSLSSDSRYPNVAYARVM